jgi:hypothetical protein
MNHLAGMPAGMRTWMTVRNDDIYSFRWGDPEFARAYLQAMPGPDVLAGLYMGPDGYTWGREFIKLLTRVGYVDLNALSAKVEHDIALAKGE